MKAADLFAGAGGLSEGLRSAGWTVVYAAEANEHACATHALAHQGVALARGFLAGDEELPAGLDLIAGGPPCQPFSHAGSKLGEDDTRDCFPIFLRFVERCKPRAVLIENVPGLLAPRAKPYFDRVLAQLAALGYTVDWRCLQAADLGVPQRCERVFIVGFRDGAIERWHWPKPTHSLEALVAQKCITGNFDRTGATRYEGAALRILQPAKAPRLGSPARALWEAAHEARKLLPWVTVREALGNLVRQYALGPTLHSPPVLGTTNCELDDVAPTVPAKVAGQSGLALMDGATVHEWTGSEGTTEPGRVHSRPSTVIRRLSVEEVARLQTFPSDYPWQGPVTARYRQIGNAAPPRLAQHLGRALIDALDNTEAEQ